MFVRPFAPRHMREVGRIKLACSARFDGGVRLLASMQVVTRPPDDEGEGAMTRRISLIIGTAVAALALGVPAASADAWFADRQQADFWNYDAQTGRKLTDTSPNVLPGDLAALYSTASDVTGNQVPVLRRSAADSPANLDLRRRAEARSSWHARSVVVSSEPVAAGVSGDDIEWAQIGIGLGIGLLLGLGLLVALRGARHRPLPH